MLPLTDHLQCARPSHTPPPLSLPSSLQEAGSCRYSLSTDKAVEVLRGSVIHTSLHSQRDILLVQSYLMPQAKESLSEEVTFELRPG